eukprot:1638963-Rhodomonas_salina.1
MCKSQHPFASAPFSSSSVAICSCLIAVLTVSGLGICVGRQRGCYPNLQLMCSAVSPVSDLALICSTQEPAMPRKINPIELPNLGSRCENLTLAP